MNGNHLTHELDQALNKQERNTFENPTKVQCPVCYDTVNEDELIRFYSPVLEKTILACCACKQHDDKVAAEMEVTSPEFNDQQCWRPCDSL